MTTKAYFSDAKMLRRLHEGPLGLYIDVYAARLLKERHCRQSACRCLRVVSDFSRWLARRKIRLRSVGEQTVEQYQRFRKRYRCPFTSDQAALNRLLAVLREIDVIALSLPAMLSPDEQIAKEFEQYLAQECGLTRISIIRHVPVVRRFLGEICGDDARRLSTLTGSGIIGFVERHAHDQSPDSAKSMCWTLRAFLRYLQFRGLITVDLAGAVPTVRRWRFTSLPMHFSPEKIQKVLDACDRNTAMGRRDYAILMMLARLGLRANEIATLTLDDVDWRSGQLTIGGKGRQRTQMPLPPDVGAAIAAYLKHGRPHSESRRVFVKSVAPHVGFTSSSGISALAKAALISADIVGVAHMGAHIFRHSLATQLVDDDSRDGNGAPEICDIFNDEAKLTRRPSSATWRRIASTFVVCRALHQNYRVPGDRRSVNQPAVAALTEPLRLVCDMNSGRRRAGTGVQPGRRQNLNNVRYAASTDLKQIGPVRVTGSSAAEKL